MFGKDGHHVSLLCAFDQFGESADNALYCFRAILQNHRPLAFSHTFWACHRQCYSSVRISIWLFSVDIVVAYDHQFHIQLRNIYDCCCSWPAVLVMRWLLSLAPPSVHNIPKLNSSNRHSDCWHPPSRIQIPCEHKWTLFHDYPGHKSDGHNHILAMNQYEYVRCTVKVCIRVLKSSLTWEIVGKRRNRLARLSTGKNGTLQWHIQLAQWNILLLVGGADRTQTWPCNAVDPITSRIAALKTRVTKYLDIMQA